jgi:hypothetical protein
MDPYLERRGLWEEVHAGLIIGIQHFLAPLLRPRYRVAIERRTYLALLPPPEQRTGKQDVLVMAPRKGVAQAPALAAAPVVVDPLIGELPLPEEVLERYLEVRDVATQEVISVIKVLSPTNKTTSEGRSQYEQKRLKVLGSLTNLVEIDLIRAGEPFAMKVAGQSDYRIVVSRSQWRPQADIYLFGVRQPIPDFPIPLRPGETEPVLPLNEILHKLYDEGAYDLAIDYQQPPEPPLSDEDAQWAAQILEKLAYSS